LFKLTSIIDLLWLIISRFARLNYTASIQPNRRR
jgi:hypothetical protein